MSIYKENLKFIFTNLIEEIWKTKEDDITVPRFDFKKDQISDIVEVSDNMIDDLSQMIRDRLEEREKEVRRSCSSLSSRLSQGMISRQFGEIRKSDKHMYISSSENIMRISKTLQKRVSKEVTKEKQAEGLIPFRLSNPANKSTLNLSIVEINKSPEQSRKSKKNNDRVMDNKRTKKRIPCYNHFNYAAKTEKKRRKSGISKQNIASLNKRFEYVSKGKFKINISIPLNSFKKSEIKPVRNSKGNCKKKVNRRYSSFMNKQS